MKKKILVQLDTDPVPSLFDRIVAVDGGAEEVFSYGGVTPEQVTALVHGAIFTRGLDDLRSTALFIGGSDAEKGEELLARARKAFFDRFRVSILLDSSGANTTAVAAVLAVARRIDLAGKRALILGGTGPVGQRVARLFLRSGAEVRLGSRAVERAATSVAAVRARCAEGSPPITAVGIGGSGALEKALDGVEVVVASGGAGVLLLPAAARKGAGSLRVVVDLNAVPPAGIEGVDPMDNGKDLDGALAFGALGVGGLKMKIHKAAVAKLFEASDLVLDAEETLEIGQSLQGN